MSSDTTGIEWTDATWNPIRGCSRVSEGCRHCYAEVVAARFSGSGQPYEGLAERTPSGPRWTGVVRSLTGDTLTQPLRWRTPRRIFVNSMSDLFHEALPDDAIDRVFAVMAMAPQHTFQILTKRPERMCAYLSDARRHEAIVQAMDMPSWLPTGRRFLRVPENWPMSNVWLGVSVEDQQSADARIPLLLKTPAAVRFISAEPLLGPVKLDPWMPWNFDTYPDVGARLYWVIVGGESGPNARPCEVAWVRAIVAQCKAAGVPAFVKQLGAVPLVPAGRLRHHEWGEGKFKHWHDGIWRVTLDDRKGGDPTEWPQDLRVREFPA